MTLIENPPALLPVLRPHLLLSSRESLFDGSKIKMGFLKAGDNQAPLEIGTSDSLQYRLVQCLFSPSNSHNVKYDPLFQTIERVYQAMMSLSPTEAASRVTKNDMAALISEAIALLGGKEIGKYLKFNFADDRMQMEVLPV